jgi:hypothetical protein
MTAPWLTVSAEGARNEQPAPIGTCGGVQMGKHPVLRVLSRIFLVVGLVTLAISFVLFSVGRTGSDILLGLFSIGLGVFSLLLMSIGAVILFFLERWDRPELR